MKIPWPPNVVERYREHFEEVRSTIGEDLQPILQHFGDAPTDTGYRSVWMLLERIVTWSVYIEKPLSLPERMYAGTIAIRSDVQNGGFHQYFSNSAGDYWKDVLFTLQAGGDQEGERHLLETVRIFPGGSPSPDRAERQAQLDALEDQDAAATWAHFSRQDELYYSLEPDIYPSFETLWRALHQVPNEPFVPYIAPGAR